ncbi:TPA: histidine--tRNA ligase, partial [Candidatus Woesearchaeota archaeon]|nr:histidine--tRNA ligase [Candidatus Woesearchaeota archaeon]
VWRADRPQRGRYREFYQCDVDVVGTKNMIADAECILIAKRVFKELELDVEVEVSNRKVLNGIIKEAGIPEGMVTDVIVTVDKFKKISEGEIEKEFREKGVTTEQMDKLLEIFKFRGSNTDKVEYLKKVLTSDEGKQGVEEMEQVLSYCDGEGVEFNLALARGLAYYTGTVFEIFMKDSEFTSSLGGGGRYNKMIGDFLEGNQEFPAVGISFGLEPITVMLQKQGKITEKKTVTELFVVPIGTVKESVKIVEELRDAGIKAEMDIAGKGVSKNLNYCNALSIPYVLFVGEDELKQGKYKLKDMTSGEEGLLSLDEVRKKLMG